MHAHDDELTWLVPARDAWRLNYKALDAGSDELGLKNIEHAVSYSSCAHYREGLPEPL